MTTDSTDRVPELLSLREPAGYVARTPWPPLAATVAVFAIVMLGFVAAFFAARFLRSFDLIDGSVLSGAPGSAGRPGWLAILISFQAAIVLATLWAADRIGGRAEDVLALGRPAQGAGIYVGSIILTFALAAALTALAWLIRPGDLMADMRAIGDIARGEQWWLTILVISIGAPLSEELLFRGFLFSALMRTRLGFPGAAVLSTIAWTSLHLGYSVTSLLLVFFIGLLFCFLLWRTGSLRVPIACHAAYNLGVLALIRAGVLPV